MYTTAIAAVEAIANGRIDVSHRIHVNERRALECLGLTELASRGLFE
jgi:hypothetical protein